MKLTNILRDNLSQRELTEKFVSLLRSFVRWRLFANYLLAVACAFIALTLYCTMHNLVSKGSDSGLLISLSWSFDVLIFWILAIPIVSRGINKIKLFPNVKLKTLGFCIFGGCTAVLGLITQSLIWDLDLHDSLKLAFHYVPVALLIFTTLLSLQFLKANREKTLLRLKISEQRKPIAASSKEALLVNKGDREKLVRIEDISMLSGAGNYVELFVGGETYLYRSTLKSIFLELRDIGFIQIHRKYIVQVKRIDSVRNLGSQSPSLILDDGMSLPVGKRYKQSLMSMRKVHMSL